MKLKSILTGIFFFITTQLMMAQPRPPQIPDGNPVPFNNVVPVLLLFSIVFLLKRDESDIFKE
ncbi:MAG: hypothetical protein KA807_00475 [Prolixibacteraceae bacterium]|nr:hypothetical protein [Prolixibacteraceae bacterium]